jgi:Ni/Fe-hydrogenase subunit HybB-like protein
MSVQHANNPSSPPSARTTWLDPRHTLGSVTDDVVATVLLQRPTWRWYAGLCISLALLLLLIGSIGYLVVVGVGIWGVQVPVAWGFAIVNFVWWIGIGHAGTLISASLLLMHQKWRTTISRFAETLTLCAITCAGLFPLLHLGRPWFFYWLLPYPNTFDVWPQFRSVLVWDVFAVLTYMIVSLLFWYVSLIPDLATLRDQTKNPLAGRIYAVFALGWRGDVRHWSRHQTANQLLAGLATVLVVSVHSIVALDFAVTNLPGWHSTIFPPYFVAGAMHSGFAMVLVLVIPLRRVYRLKQFITVRHLDALSKLMLVTGIVVGYSYAIELFLHWYDQTDTHWYPMLVRIAGPYAMLYWTMFACNVAIPQLLWLPGVRRNSVGLWCIGIAVLIGMWLERYLIIVSSLHRDFLPSSWGPYSATVWDWTTLLGTFGLFLSLLFIAVRVLPMISMFETRELASAEQAEAGGVRESADGATSGAKSSTTSGAVGGPLYGMLAEFDSSERLVEAIRHSRRLGYRKLEAYSPVPDERIVEALGVGRSRLSLLVLLGGAAGAIGGYFLQYYLNVLDYPLNVGGRPLNSVPLFALVAIELSILCASLTAVLVMLLRNGLPRLHHPMFAVPQFVRASRDRFFLCVRADDVRFIPHEGTREFLESLQPRGVWEAPA